MSIDLNSIASLLSDSSEDDDSSENSEELEEVAVEEIEKIKESESNESSPDWGNKDYSDPIDEDYKTSFNNKMGCKVWKKDSNKAELFIWNKF